MVDQEAQEAGKGEQVDGLLSTEKALQIAEKPGDSREELKINIIIKGDRILLAAQATDCDPTMTTLQGNLQAALERIPSFVEEANQQWAISPHYPKSTIPEPAPPPPPARTATSAGSRTATTKPSEPAQPRFF